MGFGFMTAIMNLPDHARVRLYMRRLVCAGLIALSVIAASNNAALADDVSMSDAQVDALWDTLPANDTSPAEKTPEEEAADALFDRMPAVEGARPVPDSTPKVFTTTQGPSGNITYVKRSDDSEFFLELLLDDRETILDQAMPVFLLDEHTLIPLSYFVDLVEFPISIDTSKGLAEGWFVKPENTFKLSYPFDFVEIRGKKIPVAAGIAEAHIDDIYVSANLISTWFPTGLTLNFNELRLYLKTHVDLPFQARAKRRARWDSARQPQQPGVDYDPDDIVRLPYQKYAAPAFAMRHSATTNKPGDGTAETILTQSMTAESDLFGMNARLNLAHQMGTDERSEINNINFLMEKEDFSGKLLGPLGATSYAIGDVTGDAFPLAGSASGRGFTFNNEPYNFVRDATQFRIDGIGPAGWDIEVFQDLDLLAFDTVGDDGRYEFEALPLKEGFNLFKIVLYGPNGEKEERFERFYLGQNMVEKGRFIYNATVLESDTPLFDLSHNKAPSTDRTLSLIGEYGLTKYLSLTGGYHHSPIDTEKNFNGFGFGLRASGGNSYAQMNTFFDKSGGQSSSVLLTGNITPKTSYSIQHRSNHNFDPDVYSTIRDTSVQLSRLFKFKSDLIPSVNATVTAGRDLNTAGRREYNIGNRLSTSFLGLSLTNEIERLTYSDSTNDRYDGRLSARYRTPFGFLRGIFNYGFYDPVELRSLSLDLQKDVNDKLSFTTGLIQSLETDTTTKLTTLRSSLDWKLDKIKIGLNGSMDSDRNKQIGVTLAYNMIPQNLSGDYEMSGKIDDLSSGRLIIRPYVDENDNGIYDEGEPLVEGVEFRNSLRGTRSTLRKDGYALLPGLGPSLANRITIDERTIEDIFVTPKQKEMLVLGKKGVSGPLGFAFVKRGYITGTLTVKDTEGEDTDLDAVHIILKDKEGKQVAEAWSEFDGYFIFDGIPVGTYQLEFPSSKALDPHYQGDGTGPYVKITSENPEIDDMVIHIHPNRFAVSNLDAVHIP